MNTDLLVRKLRSVWWVMFQISSPSSAVCVRKTTAREFLLQVHTLRSCEHEYWKWNSRAPGYARSFHLQIIINIIPFADYYQHRWWLPKAVVTWWHQHVLKVGSVRAYFLCWPYVLYWMIFNGSLYAITRQLLLNYPLLQKLFHCVI